MPTCPGPFAESTFCGYFSIIKGLFIFSVFRLREKADIVFENNSNHKSSGAPMSEDKSSFCKCNI